MPDLETISAPQPACAPSILNQKTPAGVIKADKLSVVCEADGRFQPELLKEDSVITIRVPRQRGKTSLLIRGLHQANYS